MSLFTSVASSQRVQTFLLLENDTHALEPHLSTTPLLLYAAFSSINTYVVLTYLPRKLTSDFNGALVDGSYAFAFRCAQVYRNK